MSTASDRAVIGRRIVLLTAILALIILAGVVLYFMYFGRVDPLVQSVLPITTTTTT
jgi:hypothetical protein